MAIQTAGDTLLAIARVYPDYMNIRFVAVRLREKSDKNADPFRPILRYEARISKMDEEQFMQQMSHATSAEPIVDHGNKIRVVVRSGTADRKISPVARTFHIGSSPVWMSPVSYWWPVFFNPTGCSCT